MRETTFSADVDGVPIAVSASSGGVHIEASGTMATADPATADRIASALHVAAAQVRAARGEAVALRSVESNDPTGACVVIRDESEQPVVFARADVPRLIAELGAWLAAHEVAK